MVRLVNPEIHITAVNIMSDKLQQNNVSTALLSMLCGILMYLAVDNFSKRPDSLSGITGIFLCVSTFILSGFEHSIADMNYCVLAINSSKQFTAYAYIYFIFIVSIFNGIGALLIRLLITPMSVKNKKT